MVKLSVRYDKKLGSNVFVVRDDETYVSSTKTILTVSPEYFPTIDGQLNYNIYRVDVEINVLREIGDSTVVIYDGEDVLDVKEWHGVPIPTHYDFPVNTTHRLKAMFMGNKNCLKSHSKIHEVSMDSSTYATRIKYVQGSEPVEETTEYFIKRLTEFDFEITDVNGYPVPTGALTVSYSDGTHSDSQEVSVSGGEATVDFGQAFDNIVRGLFNFRAVYECLDSDPYSPAILDFKVSKFYNVRLIGYLGSIRLNDTRYLLDDDYVIVGSITDYFGNPYVESDSVKLYGYSQGSWELITTGTVNTEGKFQTTLSASDYHGLVYTKFRFGTHGSYGFDELNPVYAPEILEVTQLDITPVGVINSNMTYQIYADVFGYTTPEGGAASLGSLANVPVRVSYQGTEIFVGLTDSQGRATIQYSPRLVAGGFTIDIKCGGKSDTYTIPYYITKYTAPTWYGQDLGLVRTSKQALQTGMQYNASPQRDNPSIIYADIDNFASTPQRFSFTVVSKTDNLFYYGLVYRDNGGNLVPVVWDYPNDNWADVGDIAEYIYDPNAGEIICTVKGRERFRTTIDNKEWSPAIIKYKGDGSIVLNRIEHELLLRVVPTEFVDSEYTHQWFGGRLVDDEGTRLAGKPVTASVDVYNENSDTHYTRTYSLVTNNDGYIEGTPERQEHIMGVTFSFSGNAYYAASTKSVTKTNTQFVDCSYDGSWWGGRLVDDDGNRLSGKPVFVMVAYIYQDTHQIRTFNKTTNADGYIEETMGYVHIENVYFLFEGDSEFNMSDKTI